ncbi:hypothetical protein [Streptomyces sp. NPDC001530]|uniref:hypothetical protein n=1 Tax=Streptomyces sp. NPDC001530 TaxID=3364582 RepID=UPI0036B93363
MDELLAELADFLTDRGDQGGTDRGGQEGKERIDAAVLLCARHRVDRFLGASQVRPQVGCVLGRG